MDKKAAYTVLGMILCLLTVFADTSSVHSALGGLPVLYDVSVSEQKMEQEKIQEEADAVLYSILEWKAAQTGGQIYGIFNQLAEYAGTSPADWYAYSILQWTSDVGPFDMEAYLEKMAQICTTPEKSDVEQYRRLLVWLVAGKKLEELPKDWVHPDTLTDKGIMSDIYRLQFQTAVNEQAQATGREPVLSSDLLDALLLKELPRGGFALAGTNPDADVTAMALQALAPYQMQDQVQECIQRGLAVLSAQQREDGSFTSFGTPNAESCAQVLTALCMLDVDLQDTAFVKNGSTVWDALLGFRCGSGAFSHLKDGSENDMATAQALYACVMLQKSGRPVSGGETEGDTEPGTGESVETAGSTEPEMSEPVETTGDAESETENPVETTGLSGTAIKWILTAICGMITLILVAASLLASKEKGDGGAKGWKKAAVILFVGGAVTVAVYFFCHIQSVGEFQQSAVLEEVTPEKPVARLMIDQLNEDEPLLALEEFVIYESDTVFTLLKRVADAKGIALDYQVNPIGGSVYIQGIGGFYEFDEGSLSGWMFRVNGTVIQSDCASVKLSDRDTVEWLYTREMGEDLPQ